MLDFETLIRSLKYITIVNSNNNKKLHPDGCPIPSGWKYFCGNDDCYLGVYNIELDAKIYVRIK